MCKSNILRNLKWKMNRRINWYGKTETTWKLGLYWRSNSARSSFYKSPWVMVGCIVRERQVLIFQVCCTMPNYSLSHGRFPKTHATGFSCPYSIVLQKPVLKLSGSRIVSKSAPLPAILCSYPFLASSALPAGQWGSWPLSYRLFL